ncbi:MAG: transcriptional repressor NrdR [Acaryochloridaceae cyanobacterium RU_4_10]|nr:transcriptional repressor NrdR [Acaryochloridaceae cyanobacterium RU_4_10]
MTVIKRDGQRESFDRSKLLRGVVTACGKTGIPAARLESLVDDIEAELQQRAVREVPSAEVGEAVLKSLKKLSEVAYVRFASVYRQFQGIRDFVEELHTLQGEQSPADRETAHPALERNAIATHQESAPNTLDPSPETVLF